MSSKCKPKVTTPSELEALHEKQRALDARIAELEALPQQLELEIKERESTLPPPEDIQDRERQREFEKLAARGQIRNERRTQGRSLLLMVLLLMAIAATVSWVFTLASR